MSFFKFLINILFYQQHKETFYKIIKSLLLSDNEHKKKVNSKYKKIIPFKPSREYFK